MPTYDANGNRNNGSYTTGTGNRITGDGTWTYSYDDEGNLTKKSKGATQETWTYGYDESNELLWVEKRATDGGTLQLRDEFRYDVFGNRIEKTYDADGAGAGSATVSSFAYDAWKNTNQHLVGNESWDVWADLNGSSSLTTRYIRGDVIDQIFSRIDSGTNYWELTDRLGSVRDVINNSAVIKDTIGYNGFGGITSETDSNFRGRYAWTGREIDTEVNLQYNRARYYDANMGRWISQDPLGFDAGDSNLYRYAAAAYSSAADPSGLLWLSAPYRDWMPGHAGAYFWTTAWSIDEPANAVRGGYVIQYVQLSVSVQTKAGTDVSAQILANAIPSYLEAWRVLPGQTTPVEKVIFPNARVQMEIDWMTSIINNANSTNAWKTFAKEVRDQLEGYQASEAKSVSNDMYSSQAIVYKGKPTKGGISVTGKVVFIDCLSEKDLKWAGFALSTNTAAGGDTGIPIVAVANEAAADAVYNKIFTKSARTSNWLRHDISVSWDGTEDFAESRTRLQSRYLGPL